MFDESSLNLISLRRPRQNHACTDRPKNHSKMDAASVLKLDMAMFAGYALQSERHAPACPRPRPLVHLSESAGRVRGSAVFGLFDSVAEPNALYMTDGSEPGAREKLWAQWFAVALISPVCESLPRGGVVDSYRTARWPSSPPS